MACQFLCFIRYPNPDSPDLQSNSSRVICRMPLLRKAKIVQKRKEQVIYFLRAASRQLGGLFVYQITLKAYRMPKSYHSLKSGSILTISDTEKKNREKARKSYLTIRQVSDNTWISLHKSLYTKLIVAAIMFSSMS